MQHFLYHRSLPHGQSPRWRPRGDDRDRRPGRAGTEAGGRATSWSVAELCEDTIEGGEGLKVARTGGMDPRMLARYRMVRGAPASSLPRGERQDTRKHTRHVLRPSPEIVEEVFGSDGDEAAWARYAERYRAILEERFEADRAPFDRLAKMARYQDVYLGCSCPSSKNPDVRRCHTVLALAFMKERYPELDVRMP